MAIYHPPATTLTDETGHTGFKRPRAITLSREDLSRITCGERPLDLPTYKSPDAVGEAFTRPAPKLVANEIGDHTPQRFPIDRSLYSVTFTIRSGDRFPRADIFGGRGRFPIGVHTHPVS